MTVSRDAIIWCYRLFLDREPESEIVITSRLQTKDHFELIQIFLESEEFKKKSQQKEKNTTKTPEETENHEIKTINITELPSQCFMNENSKKINGKITYPKSQETHLKNITIGFHGSQDPTSLTGIEVKLESIPSLFIDFSHNNQKIKFGKNCHGRWIFHLWGENNTNIGNNITSNGVDCFINPGGNLYIGDDCMFANIFIHVGDNHAIFDMDSGLNLNFSEAPFVTIKEHIWIASRATILADTTIEAGCIIGTGSVVKGHFSPCSLIVGTPAKSIKDRVSWTRSYNGEGAQKIKNYLENILEKNEY